MPMNALDVIRFDLQEAAEGLNRLIGSPEVLENISRAADLIVEAQRAGGKGKGAPVGTRPQPLRCHAFC